MRLIIRAIAGISYLLFKHLSLILCSIIVLVWYFDINRVKDIYEDSSIFYVSTFPYGTMECYRYNTFVDFIHNRKDYSNRWNKY